MNVLACSDGLSRSLRALSHAGAFAHSADTRLFALRVLDPREIRKEGPRQSHEDAVKALRTRSRGERTKELRAARVKGTPRVTIRGGGERTADAIVREVEELDAELIAMDSRSAGALRHALRGSTGMSVLGRTSRPVMFTTDKTAPPTGNRPFRIVATTDGSERSDDVVRAITPWLKQPGTRMALLRLHVPARMDAGSDAGMDQCQREVLAQVKRLNLPKNVPSVVETVREFETVAAGIERVAEELGADAIAMSTQGHTAARHILLGSVAAAVLSRSRLPVIMARVS